MKRRTIPLLVIALVLLAAIALIARLRLDAPIYCIHDYMECRQNMFDLWLALYDYAEDHGGMFPAELRELHPHYIDLYTIRCPMQPKTSDPLETGYHYIPGLTLKSNRSEPVLVCRNYHINGHSVTFNLPGVRLGIDRYVAAFGIETCGGGFVLVMTRDLHKYNGPARRRYHAFKAYPYDGSKPTPELAQSLKTSLSDYVVWLDERGQAIDR